MFDVILEKNVCRIELYYQFSGVLIVFPTFINLVVNTRSYSF